MGFRKAERRRVKLRLALDGPAGSGKTYSALEIAKHLGGRWAVIDTEFMSAELYADLFDFDTAPLEPPYHPDRYVALMKDAARAGYDGLIIDSMSHAWTGQGGMIDLVEAIAQKNLCNFFQAWGKGGTRIQNDFIAEILRAPLHVIATMRCKTHYDVGKDDKGKTTIEKVGLAPVQREGVEYEFTAVGDLNLEHVLTVSKSRIPSIADKAFRKPGEEFALLLKTWLESGADKPAPPAEPPADEAQREALAEMERDPAAPEKMAGVLALALADENLTAKRADELIARGRKVLADQTKENPGE